MICPSCISGEIGPGYIAAFAICALFFIVAFGVMWWASKSGMLEDLEDTKHRIFQDD